VAHRQPAALQVVAGVNGQLAVCCIGRERLGGRSQAPLLGKLPIAPGRFRDEMRSAGATVLSVTDEHVLTRVKAAEAHRDPFDRLLLSVAEAENLVLLTADTALIALGRQEPRLPIRHA
jgi:hypothetical protein